MFADYGTTTALKEDKDGNEVVLLKCEESTPNDDRQPDVLHSSSL
jgi:hypothetical protein